MKKLKKSEVGVVGRAVPSKFLRNPDHFRMNKVTDTAVQTLIKSMKDGEDHCLPLTVYAEEGKFIISEGDRRFLAAKELKWETIPYHVVDKHDAPLIALKMNLHREELTPIERAEEFKRVMVHYGMKHQKELAVALGMTETGISGALAILKLPDAIRDQLHEAGRKIPLRKLIKLSRVAEPEALAEMFAELLAEHKFDEGEVCNEDAAVSADTESAEELTLAVVNPAPEAAPSSKRDRSSPYDTFKAKIEEIVKRADVLLNLEQPTGTKKKGPKQQALSEGNHQELQEIWKATDRYMRTRLGLPLNEDEATNVESEATLERVPAQENGDASELHQREPSSVEDSGTDAEERQVA